MYERLTSDLYTTLAKADRRALEYVIRGWTLPSAGPEEDSYNQALTRVCSELENEVSSREVPPSQGEVVEGLAWLDDNQPATQKLNLRNASPAFHEARKAWSQAFRALALRLDPRYDKHVAPPIRHRVWRERALYGHPDPVLGVGLGDFGSVSMTRLNSRDRWLVSLKLPTDGGVDRHEHPYWLESGHITPVALDLRAVVHDAAPHPEDQGAGQVKVVSVLLTHRDGCHRTGCPLPAGTEARVFSDGTVRWSAWAERADTSEALLPHVSQGRVRLGNHIIEPIPGWTSRSREWYKARERLDEPPDGLTFHSNPGAQATFFAPKRGTTPYYLRFRRSVTLYAGHPDHYWVQCGPSRWFEVTDAKGVTQFRVLRDRGD